MDIQEVYNQFTIRYYHWAQADFQREIASGFPLLRQIKDKYLLLRVLPTIESLPVEDQYHLASALVKRFHAKAVKLLNTEMTEKEKLLYQWYIDSTKRTGQEELELNKQIERFHTKRKRFATLIKQTLTPVLGNDVTPLGDYEPYYVWQYWTPIGNYTTPLGQLTLCTLFDVGGDWHQLCYDHSIVQKGYAYLTQGARISIFSWLGIASQTMWNLLTDADTAEAAQTLALLCSHFLQAVPALLDGLIEVQEQRNIAFPKV